MKQRLFWICFILILLLAFIIRILPTAHNNFYFTMDQGNDAVHVRQILSGRQQFLLGPETNITGLFAGPGWYYFLAIGYALFGGHPMGGVFMMVLLNVFLTAIIMLVVKREVSPLYGLITGAWLQTAWSFYDTSRYAFNPFPLVFLSWCLVVCQVNFMRGNSRAYVLGALCIACGIHAEIAGTMALTLFYTTIGIWGIVKRKLPWRTLAASVTIVLIALLPHIVSEFTTGFAQTHVFFNELGNPTGVFSNSADERITPFVFKVVARTIIRQIPIVSVALFILLACYTIVRLIRKEKLNRFVSYFLLLTLVLCGVTWTFFLSNNGWRDWHTVYLSPLIFISLILLTHELPRVIAVIILSVSLVSHMLTFVPTYMSNFVPTSDQSLLHNELAAVDWVYTHAKGKGFSVYHYLPSVYDYPYQYIYPWYGKKTYGYLPCEFSTYPDSPKINVPGDQYYENPKRPCTGDRFLIIEPAVHEELRTQWMQEISAGTHLVESTHIGAIRVEHRITP